MSILFLAKQFVTYWINNKYITKFIRSNLEILTFTSMQHIPHELGFPVAVFSHLSNIILTNYSELFSPWYMGQN